MQNAFTIEDLSYRYPSKDTDVIKGITFNVKQGEIFGFLGPSGAGKSTTQKLMIKLLNDYRGNIKYFDRDLKKINESYYEEIGVGFEMPVHFGKLTGLENMKYFSSFYKNKADIKNLMEKVGLWEFRDVLVSQYSKGMKVRLNFVRAMLNNPKVLFLDEVTNGLDPKNAMIIKKMIYEFKKDGGTVFLTTHLMNDVEQLCDQVAFCVDGKLYEIATPRDLKLKYGKKEVTVEYHENNNILTRDFELNDLGFNDDFQTLLKSNRLETIHSGETTMEDIFIKVTGEVIHE